MASLAGAIGPAGLWRNESAPTLRFTGPGRSSGVRRFVIDGMAHVRLRVQVNGVEVDAILDTGAARTILDEGFARRLGLAAQPGWGVAGITDMAVGAWAEPIRLSLGDLTLEGLQPGVLDLQAMTASAEGPASLLIGRELFEPTVAGFDFELGQVSFTDVALANPGAGGHTAPLGVTPGGTPFIPVALNGRPPVMAALDIGFNGSMMVSPLLADSLGLLRDRPVSTVASRGAEGMSINRIATCDRVEFAGNLLTGAPVEVPAAWNRSIPAVLGLDILHRFKMVTEFGRRQVSFLPNAALAGLPLPKDRSGIGAAPTPDGVVVVHVATDSPAEGAGLKAGDVIRRINGELADLAYVRSHPRLGAGSAGTTFVLQLYDGRAAALTLADYY